jgi:DNA polymerase-3 subunit delta
LSTLCRKWQLVFVEPAALPSRHPLRLLAARDQELGYDREFPVPKGGELRRWIAQRVEERGGSITPDATTRLAAFIGDNLRLMAQEIDKLLAYVDRDRPIAGEDVDLLVSDAREANVFDMVDALGQRDQRRASRLLHQLLDGGDHPLALQGMMVRQFRILIQVKELNGQGLAQGAIARQLGLHPFVIRKALAQQRNFTMAQLESIQARLLDTDVSIKTGRTEAVLALDMLVASMTAP